MEIDRSFLKKEGLHVKSVTNIEKLSVGVEILPVNITLCPLYGLGDLASSNLIVAPMPLDKSRVAVKWREGVRLLSLLRKMGIRSVVSFTIADLGILSRGEIENVEAVIEYHTELYTQAAQNDLIPLGINWTIDSYSDIALLKGLNFPRFIRPGGVLDKTFSGKSDIEFKTNEMIGRLRKLGVVFDAGVSLGRFTQLVAELGVKTAEGLLWQYGVFDGLITQDQSLNAYFERSSTLLQITDLFPHRVRPRIDILC